MGARKFQQSNQGINATQAWEQTTGSTNTVIAIIDSGIDFTQADLAHNEWTNPVRGVDPHGWDYVTDSGKIVDVQGHGTAVAGIIAAEGNNSVGISGVMWRASLMSLRVLDNNGTGDVAHAVEAIDYAVAHGAQIINLSWGMENSSVALLGALKRAARRGVLVVCSAGNDGRDIDIAPHHPASLDLPNVISVASIDSTDSLASWSNRSSTRVSVAAPGVGILTTKAGGDYQTISGTSASAAFVSGVAGLIRTLRPWLSAQATRQMIVQSARPVPALSGKVSTAGVVNAAAAIEAVSMLPAEEGSDSASGNNGGTNAPSKLAASQAGANSSSVADAINAAERPQRLESGYTLPGAGEMRGSKAANPRAPSPAPSVMRSRRHPLSPLGPARPFLPQQGQSRAALYDEQSQSAPINLLVWSSTPFSIESLFGATRQSLSDSPPTLLGRSHNLAPAALALQPSSTAYLGTTLAIPGNIEAEYFDNGGESVAYHDATSGSYGQDYDQPPNYPMPSFRQPTDVDIYKKNTFSSSYLIMMQAGEWLRYWVNVASGGTYTLRAQVAWGNSAGGTFHIEIDGVDRTGPIQIPDTGWNLQVISKTGVALSPGMHTMRVMADTNAPAGAMGDIDYIQFVSETADQPPVANAGGPYNSSTGQAVQFNASGSFDPDGTIAGYAWNFGDGTTGSGATPLHTYTVSGNYTVLLTVTDNSGTLTTVSTTVTVGATTNQFVIDFHNAALARQPNSTELQYWDSNLEYSYAQATDSRLITAQELGRTLFESNDYAQRSRDNHGYVYDLYRAYLNRDPDAGGWAYWENQVPSLGREQVRLAFAQSGEFASRVSGLLSGSSIGSTASNLLMARAYPENQAGGASVDLLSRGLNWSVPLVSLPGRAGLDLGLSLSYSSLVWTRSGSYIYFDEDHGDPSPGFRIGFPKIQGQLFDPQAGKKVYLLITPSGNRVELQQVGTTNLYESVDSSYLQLETSPLDASTMLLRTADGTQLSYSVYNHEYRCTQVKDRNGNYITVNYNWLGEITTVVDTAGRTINFNYDANANITKITQVWDQGSASQRTHDWVTFGWDTLTLQPGFSGLNVIGAYSGETIPVLKWIGFDDQSYVKFTYSQRGQVSRITRYAADSVSGGALLDTHPLSYADYTFDSVTQDCPRVSSENDWAENWHIVGGQATAVTTQYRVDADGAHVVTLPDRTYMPDGVTLDHDNTEYREYYGAKMWQRGLTVRAEWKSNNAVQKSVVNTWTQGNVQQDEDSNIILNPRLTNTTISDAAGNNRRTRIDYQQFTLPSGSKFYLPSDVTEYAANATTELRKSHTDYLNYLDRHILGLPSVQTLTDGAATLFAKVDYQYDSVGTAQDPFLRNDGEPVQHDPSYGAGFATRGNLTRVRRWNTSYPTDETKTIAVAQAGFDTAGCLIFTRDALGHQTSVSYTDAFSTTGHQLTLAYGTRVTDAGNYASTAIYNYDRGIVVHTEDPKAAGTNISYDDANRTSVVTNLVNNAYTRLEYPAQQNLVKSFTTIQEGQNGARPEAYAVKVLDGMGRVIATASDLPNSVGHYTGQQVVYDTMGRVSAQSNPTETDALSGGWHPVGDDVQAGWLYTSQIFDWKGRPRIITNTDGTTSEASYSGCGCAGGDVTTLSDEGTIVGGVLKRRQQVITRDILGRVVNSKVLDFNGNIYTTVVNTYNVRDQLTSVRQYQGESGAFQESTMAYDSYGRLSSKHLPEQSDGMATSYAYNLDDTVQSVTDARGAMATFTYNSRHMVTGISYSTPNASLIPAAPPVSMDYDSAGNRTFMIDGAGRIDYGYDSLSHLKSETRQFTELGSFTLSYDYNLAGDLKSITDPTGATINYERDQIGRVTAITGTPYGGVSQYATAIQYRAWGAVKGMTYGNNLNVSASYNSRLQLQHFEVGNLPLQYNQSQIGMKIDYFYHPDGNVRYSHDALNGVFDRAFAFDEMGRLSEAYSGVEARDYLNQTQSNLHDGPYHQSYSHDVWNNMTARTNRFWSQSDTFAAQYDAHNRRLNANGQGLDPAWHYDAEGNILQNPDMLFTFDAAGRNTTAQSTENAQTITVSFSGEGQVAKRRTDTGDTSGTIYYLNSSVLGGQVLTTLNSQGQKVNTFVYMGAEVLAEQGFNYVTWKHTDPVTGRRGESAQIGQYSSEVEPDPMGVNVGTADPFIDFNITPPQDEGGGALLTGSEVPNGRCTLDGIPYSCEDAAELMQNGAALRVPTEGMTRVKNGKLQIFDPSNGGSYRYLTRDVVPKTFPDGSPGAVYYPWRWETVPNSYSDSYRLSSLLPFLRHNSSQQGSASTLQPSQKLTGCIINISITTNGLINSKQLQAMMTEMTRIFAEAGQEVNFVRQNADYYLSINAHGANYTNNSSAVGFTSLNGQAVTNAGRVFVDRLTDSATSNASSETAFNQDSNALAVGLARAGTHETGHFLLQQNYDSGSIQGVMHDGFNGSEWFSRSTQGAWKFTPNQIKQLNALCGR